MKNTCIGILGIFFLFFSCINQEEIRLQRALKLAGENREELEKVLDHYKTMPDGNLKYKAARFLIENMIYYYSYDFPSIHAYYASLDSLLIPQRATPGYHSYLSEKIKEIEKGVNKNQIRIIKDIENIQADFLISHIDQAFEMQKYPWIQELSFEDFCEYVLPYRISKEPLTNWISFYQNALRTEIDSLVAIQATDSMVCEALRLHLVNPVDWYHYSFQLEFPATSLLNKGAGRCNDISMMAIFALRSLGIPVAYDFTPQWANRSMGHSWTLVQAQSGNFLPFQLGDEARVGDHLKNKTIEKLPKVFRHTASLQEEHLKLQYAREPVYPFFTDPYLKDVSSLYFEGVDIAADLTLPPPAKKEYAYIAVFDNKDWIPVHYAKIERNKALFTGMGKGCVYLVMYYHEDKLFPAGNPFIVEETGEIRHLSPDPTSRQTVTVTRKHPPFKYEHMDRKMLGGYFQVANRPDFSDAVEIHTITGFDKDRLPEPILLENPVSATYFRYMSAEKAHVYMAEIMVYNEDGEKLEGEIIGTYGSFHNNGMDKTKVFDGDILTYYFSHVHTGCWVGLAFDTPQKIKKVIYFPANDDNFINPQEEYELFYYDKGWVSMGKRTGDETRRFEYHHVPDHALLLLKNHTKGIEERIFTYEDEKQVWW
ncbi:MAG: transglutaminase-like domain-containing protein [Candidatus Azobacteroides sp.]|nr:transglutaminase-like domain-containing protein [Candidatus Azobacteroides sp.]